jgi:hypothetical protein
MLSERSQQTREEFTLLSLNVSNSACDVLAELDCRNRRREVRPGTQLRGGVSGGVRQLREVGMFLVHIHTVSEILPHRYYCPAQISHLACF